MVEVALNQWIPNGCLPSLSFSYPRYRENRHTNRNFSSFSQYHNQSLVVVILSNSFFPLFIEKMTDLLKGIKAIGFSSNK